MQIGARYHDKCRIRFFFQPVYRQQFQIKKVRPGNDTRMYYFEKLCEYLEQEGDLHTLTLPISNPDEEKKASKAFIKPFEAPQRSVKIKI